MGRFQPVTIKVRERLLLTVADIFGAQREYNLTAGFGQQRTSGLGIHPARKGERS